MQSPPLTSCVVRPIQGLRAVRLASAVVEEAITVPGVRMPGGDSEEDAAPVASVNLTCERELQGRLKKKISTSIKTPLKHRTRILGSKQLENTVGQNPFRTGILVDEVFGISVDSFLQYEYCQV